MNKSIRPSCCNTLVASDDHVWIIDLFDNLQKEITHIESEYCKSFDDPLILFRGQCEARWKLDSKFVRSCKALLFGESTMEPPDIIKDSVEYHQALFALLLFKFKTLYPSPELEQAAIDRGVDPMYELHRNIQQHPENDRPLQIKGSLLMDWTTSMDVALFFMNYQCEGDGAIYICNASATGKTKHDDYGMVMDKMLKANNRGEPFGCPLFIHPPVQTHDERVIRQKAVYCAQMDMRYSLDEIWSNQEVEMGNTYIYKKLILKSGTQKIIDDYLASKGVNCSYLFP